MPRVVLLLLLTLAAVTLPALGCTPRTEDRPEPVAVVVPTEEPGLESQPIGDLDDINGVKVIEQELPFGDRGLLCEYELDLFRLSDYPATRTPRWLFAVPPPTNFGSSWLDPGIPAWVPGFVSVPPMLAVRCRPNRGHILRPGASSEAGERAVAWGLQWLAHQQKADGGWEFDGTDSGDRVAATGLALLAFLGSGYTHTLTLVLEPDGDPEPLPVCCSWGLPVQAGHYVVRRDGRYHLVVQRGLEFLLARCLLHGESRGAMSRNTRSHAIATLALCEAHAMTRDNRLLLVAAQAAVYHLAKTQGPSGGWGFTPGASEDMLVVGWVVQAFHAARAGNAITVPRDTVKGIGRFLDHTSAGPHRSAYGTADPRDAAPGTTATATGLLVRLLIGDWALDNRGLATGLTGLEQRVPSDRATLFDVEFCYYATLMFRLFEGSEWMDWMEGQKHPDGVRRRGLRTELANLQVQKEGPDRGRFNPAAGWVGKQWGALGTTALCVLTLEAPYRQRALNK